ncbi:hypothetical protein [Aquirufa regiilacus]|uniref:Uncharacterized protein n=1 Tax=Aquirufa regiilacus TaxID=3024868 RepID=A0ABU3TSP1_9BACT|nr:hypothetical protein [Aquirufa sp. LEOWEIH-7C]MDU0808889.1 hypothetical protein [Aquirufa sp. LEOWEIH-7C]
MRKLTWALLCLGLARCSKEVLSHKITTGASPMSSWTYVSVGFPFTAELDQLVRALKALA